MGKKWIQQNRGGKQGGNACDLSSCRGHGVIIGTCDSAKERETTVELSRLFNLALEDMESSGLLTLKESPDDNGDMSIAEMIAKEVKSARQTQHITSINTDTKGLVLLRLSKYLASQGVTPLKIITCVFDRIRKTREANSKFACRLIPLSLCFYPNEDELQGNLRKCIRNEFPKIALPQWVCLKHLVAQRDLDKEAKRAAAAAKKQARQDAYKAAQGEADGKKRKLDDVEGGESDGEDVAGVQDAKRGSAPSPPAATDASDPDPPAETASALISPAPVADPTPVSDPYCEAVLEPIAYPAASYVLNFVAR